VTSYDLDAVAQHCCNMTSKVNGKMEILTPYRPETVKFSLQKLDIFKCDETP